MWRRFSTVAARRVAQVGAQTQGTHRVPRHLVDAVTVDRALPDPMAQKRKLRVYFAMFCAAMGLSVFGMIKYEAANSPIVSSTLYTLRRSKVAREIIGENVRFASTMPWISGSAGIAQKEVNFSYNAVGTKGSATIHFKAEKVPGEHRFKVLDWSLTPTDGTNISLMNEDYHPHVPGPKEEPGMRPALK